MYCVKHAGERQLTSARIYVPKLMKLLFVDVETFTGGEGPPKQSSLWAEGGQEWREGGQEGVESESEGGTRNG